MKKIISSILLGVIIAMLITMASVYAKNDALCDKLVRVHIIANSDLAIDQALKIGVRDEIFKHFQNDFAKFKTKEDTISYLNKNKQNIENVANEFLLNSGCDNKAIAKITDEKFPQKQYDTFCLPKGDYTALKIIIGEGKGKNYFCVMFPPVCVTPSIETEKTFDNTLNENELNKISKVQYKFKIVEVIQSIF